MRDLPAPAYAVGFVRTYARTLGLDEDEVVRRFREASGPAVQRKTDLVFPEPVPERGLPAGAVVLAGAVLAVGAYIGWYQWSGSGDRTVDAVAPVPPRIEQAARLEPAPAPSLATPPPAPSPTTAQAAPVPPLAPAAALPAAPAAAPPAAAATEGRILIRARADSWIQLRDRGTGTVILNRVLRPGETYAVPPREGLLFSTGNAGGLDILVDGQPIPALGGAQSVRRDLLLEPDRLKSGQPPQPAATPRPAQ